MDAVTQQLTEAVPVPDHIPPEAVYDFDMRFDPGLLENPHERLREILREAPPVFWTPRNGGRWIAMGYQETFDAARDPEHFSSSYLPKEQMDAMLAMIADSWLEAAQRTTRLAPHLALSLACYMLNGHPIVGYDWGCYGRLQALTDHVETLLTEQVSTRLQRSVTVQAFHDGAAAAMVYAGAAKTAVLTFGTAIGNGYPPEVSRLRPTSDNLAIS